MTETLETLRERHRFRIEVLNDAAWEILEIPGPGTPVIFLAGGQGTAEVFFKSILRLEGQIAMLGIHYPAEPDAAKLAEDLAPLLDRLGIGNVSIVGSSFGAYVAQFFAARDPDRIERLILGNTFVDAEEVKHLSVFDRAELESYAPHAFKAERVAALKAQPDSEYRTIMLDQIGSRQSAESVLARMMGVAISVPAPETGVDPLRITVIDCEDDAVIAPGMKATVTERFAGADIRVLKTGGHFPNILNPDDYTEILREKLLAPAEQDT